VNDVFPFESTKEIKLGLESVDSGASVIVLVVVPVKDTCGACVAGGTGDEAWPMELVGLVGDAFVDPGLPLVFTAGLVLLLELGLATEFTTPGDEVGGGTEAGFEEAFGRLEGEGAETTGAFGSVELTAVGSLETIGGLGS